MYSSATLNSSSDGSFATLSLSSVSFPPGVERSALAHVPFDFVVGERLCRAGTYAIEPRLWRGMLVVRRADSKAHPLLVQAIAGKKRKRRPFLKLLFYCRDNSYFLAQVVLGLG